MGLSTKYRKSMEHKWVIRLKTIHPREKNFEGVVLHNGRNYIVLAEVDQFEFNGLLILPKRVLAGCRDGASEEVANQNVRMNGALQRIKLPTWLGACGTLREALAAVDCKRIWPAVEILYNDNRFSALYLGPITRISGTRIWQRCYDAAGEWEREYEYNEREVFRVELQSRYCRHFNRYMKTRPRPE